LKLEVNDDLWRRRENVGPPRPQSQQKLKDLQKQLLELVDTGVIRPSQEPYYSQILLVPKPDLSWRFCLDFRYLNLATKMMGWPLPNIMQLLHRVGAKLPRFFAKMDATKGYYQAPLHLASIPYTAFTTPFGNFEWIRVPMGLSGAPSYFQQQLSTTVLAGLIYDILELYIDDIVVHAQTEEDYLSRLRTVFQRLREFNVTLNSSKCQFGLEQIEFLGHVIDHHGLTMSTRSLLKSKSALSPKLAKYYDNLLD